ncbi:MAG: hypothetical protein LAO22_13170 [Acidobacteriia bacterium]|nr:hypothetical protein [Terriglobia bacterium]
MRRRVLLTLLLLGLSASSFAVESGLLTLTIVRAEQKTRDRVLLYLVDTPIYQEDPVFEVAVRAGGLVVVGERDPEHKWETLPADWKPGALVEGRIEKHRLYLRRPNGTYVRFIITSRTKAPAEQHD